MSIEKVFFGKSSDGQDVFEYILTNSKGAKLQLLTYGARIHKMIMPDRDNKLADVVLGYDKLEDYFGNDFQGACVGRYANRIGKAKFELNGTTYNLTVNDNSNTLHGGPGGYHQIVWDVKSIDEDKNSITFSHLDPDMHENYPGNVDVTVTYTLTDDNEVSIKYEAEADKETVFNITNHSFFNLSGIQSSDVLGTELKIYASHYTPVTDDLIPTGEVLPVNAYLDFTEAKALGKDMFADDHMISLNGGFDHNFCVDGKGFRLHAEAYEPTSGRVMKVYSDLPAVQLFTFNKAPDVVGKYGCKMVDHGAFCLETQFYPDSPNHPNFPFETLKPGKKFVSETKYSFSVK